MMVSINAQKVHMGTTDGGTQIALGGQERLNAVILLKGSRLVNKERFFPGISVVNASGAT